MRITLVGICLVFGLIIANLSFAIEPEDVTDGHVWLFDDGEARDSTNNNLSGNIIGSPKSVPGLSGDALEFNGANDGIHIPDSAKINVTGGPWSDRTVMVVFSCSDVSKREKQTIFEEGGRTRGLTIYVFDGEVYVGGWNRAEYNWNGEWISEPIKSDTWYSAALVIRDGAEKVEDDKFEMWLDGKLIEKRPGGQIHNHSNDNSIGYTKENNVFHDEDGNGDGFYFGGIIDEVWIINQALTAEDMKFRKLSVESANKLAATWGNIKIH